MTASFLLRHSKNYYMITLLLLGSWLFSFATAAFLRSIGAIPTDESAILIAFFEIIIVFIFGFLAYECAKPTVIPSFVVAIVIGLIERQSLAIIANNSMALTILTTLGASFILFGGGLETPFKLFKKLLGPILSIAFFGTLITAFLFSITLSVTGVALGTIIPLGAVILVGAALASTDPAAIIPSLKSLTFKNPRLKYIAISESAINDVVGAVLTGVFLTLIAVKHITPSSIGDAYASLLTFETGLEVLWELLIGCAVGFFGFGILHMWSKWKANSQTGGDADAALFLAIPLLCYVLAIILGGSGFLAVFVAGLLFQLEDHVKHVEHYFNHTIEGIMKPLIFMLLGAMVDPHDLISIAPLGIIMGLIFMFIIRPIAVFATLTPFMRGTHSLGIRELLFLSFVRETGVIPAVLLMGLRVSGVPGTETAVAVGLWIILLTLVIQPACTPAVARLLGIATDVPPFPSPIFKEQVAVLCSRGNSFTDRLDIVADWANARDIDRVILLHCGEDKYSKTFVEEARHKADALFKKINKRQEKDEKTQTTFQFLAHPGLLTDNIEKLLDTYDAAIVFVGKKMLDYRMEDVKRLRVPFVFLP